MCTTSFLQEWNFTPCFRCASSLVHPLLLVSHVHHRSCIHHYLFFNMCIIVRASTITLVSHVHHVHHHTVASSKSGISHLVSHVHHRSCIHHYSDHKSFLLSPFREVRKKRVLERNGLNTRPSLSPNAVAVKVTQGDHRQSINLYFRRQNIPIRLLYSSCIDQKIKFSILYRPNSDTVKVTQGDRCQSINMYFDVQNIQISLLLIHRQKGKVLRNAYVPVN